MSRNTMDTSMWSPQCPHWFPLFLLHSALTSQKTLKRAVVLWYGMHISGHTVNYLRREKNICISIGNIEELPTVQTMNLSEWNLCWRQLSAIVDIQSLLWFCPVVFREPGWPLQASVVNPSDPSVHPSLCDTAYLSFSEFCELTAVNLSLINLE